MGANNAADRQNEATYLCSRRIVLLPKRHTMDADRGRTVGMPRIEGPIRNLASNILHIVPSGAPFLAGFDRSGDLRSRSECKKEIPRRFSSSGARALVDSHPQISPASRSGSALDTRRSQNHKSAPDAQSPMFSAQDQCTALHPTASLEPAAPHTIRLRCRAARKLVARQAVGPVQPDSP